MTKPKKQLTRIDELKALIEKSGLSIAQVARKADINHQTLYNFLQGKSDITLANFDKILDALGKSVNRKGKNDLGRI